MINFAATLNSGFSGKATRFGRKGSATTSRSKTYRATPNDFINSFYAVLRRWQSETAFLSDPEKIASHPSYKALVEHAFVVTPLIVEELRIQPSLLVWVLDDAYGETPYPASDTGNVRAMSEAWIAWADRNGRTLQSTISSAE